MRRALLLLVPAVVATPSAAGAQGRQQSTVLMSEDEGERAFQAFVVLGPGAGAAVEREARSIVKSIHAW